MLVRSFNCKSKEILTEMNPPEINPEGIVFHSLRHTSTTAKLFVSHGDYNSVMQAGAITRALQPLLQTNPDFLM